MFKRSAGVAGVILVTAAVGLIAGGCGGSSDDEGKAASAVVLEAYTKPTSGMMAMARQPHELGLERMQRLAAACDQALNDHPGAPPEVQQTIRELKQIAEAAAQKYSVAPQQGQAWMEAQALTEQFNTKVNELPGAAEALGGDE